MDQSELLKKIDAIQKQIDEVSDDIEYIKPKEYSFINWDFLYTKIIRLYQSANRVKIQIKNKTT